MANLPGPNEIEFFVRINSTPVNREHVLRFSTGVSGSPALGLPMSSYNLLKKGGGTVAADVAVNLLWSFLRQFYHTGVTCFAVNLWRYAAGTTSKDFMSAMAVTTPAGTNVSGHVFAQQQTLSFRSGNGGIQKVIILEGSIGGDTRNTLISNAAGTVPQKLASYMMSADNVTLARDDSFAIAPLRDSGGQNERIWKSVYR